MAGIRIAGIQISSFENASETLEKAERWIETAVSEGAEMVCLPELFANHFVGTERRLEWRELAETLEGPLISRMKAISAYHGVGLLAPFYERDGSSGIGYNSAAFINGGEVTGSYRKTYIPETVWNFERFYFAPGKGEVPVVRVADIDMASIICYDRHFPELARLATFMGARVLLVPTASADRAGRTNTYLSELVGLAAANGLYVMGINRTGREGSTTYFGGSCSVGPDGTVIEALGVDEGLVWCEVDTSNQDRIRERFGHLRDVREDIFKRLAGVFEKEGAL